MPPVLVFYKCVWFGVQSWQKLCCKKTCTNRPKPTS